MSPGGTGPTFGAAASVAYERPFWSAGAIGAVPLTDSQISGPEGSAHVSTLFSGGFGELALVRGTFRANAGLGLAAAMTKMRGAAAAGYAGFDETIFVTAPFARFSAKLELGSAWRLGLVTMLGTALPHVSVRFADREVATWGRPYFLVATLGIEAPLLVR
jgi:hypothetical protein